MADSRGACAHGAGFDFAGFDFNDELPNFASSSSRYDFDGTSRNYKNAAMN